MNVEMVNDNVRADFQCRGDGGRGSSSIFWYYNSFFLSKAFFLLVITGFLELDGTQHIDYFLANM